MLGYYEVLTEGDEPLSVADAKTFMRVETDADDDLIDVLISAARVSAENFTNRSFLARTWRVSFPGSLCGQNEIKRSPVTSVSSVEEWNETSEDWDTVEDTVVRLTNGFATVRYPYAIAEPEDAPYGVRISFAGGYTSETLPKALLQALKMHVAFLYENRGDVEAVGGVKIPAAAELIYRQHRIIATYG